MISFMIFPQISSFLHGLTKRYSQIFIYHQIYNFPMVVTMEFYIGKVYIWWYVETWLYLLVKQCKKPDIWGNIIKLIINESFKKKFWKNIFFHCQIAKCKPYDKLQWKFVWENGYTWKYQNFWKKIFWNIFNIWSQIWLKMNN